jgi:hypothetical protein
MKNLLKIAIMLFAIVAFTACNNAPATENETEEVAPAATEKTVEVEETTETVVDDSTVVEEVIDSSAVEVAPKEAEETDAEAIDE